MSTRYIAAANLCCSAPLQPFTLLCYCQSSPYGTLPLPFVAELNYASAVPYLTKLCLCSAPLNTTMQCQRPTYLSYAYAKLYFAGLRQCHALRIGTMPLLCIALLYSSFAYQGRTKLCQNYTSLNCSVAHPCSTLPPLDVS